MLTSFQNWKRPFWKLARINILANFTIPLVGLADAGMLGQLPDVRFLGGLALGSLIFDYVYWSLGFLRMSTTGLTAQAIGRRDEQEQYAILYRSLIIGWVLAALILVTRSWIGDIAFFLLSGDASVQEAGRQYFEARIWAAPATLGNFCIFGWLLGRGESVRVLWLSLLTNICNLLLNYLLILHLGLAAVGAGLATAASQYVGLAAGLLFVLRSPGETGRPPVRRLFSPGSFGRFLSLNRDIFIRTFCLITAFALFTDLSAFLGTAVLAANALLLRLLMFAAFVIDGIAYAIESLVGALYGGRRWSELLDLCRHALYWSTFFGCVFAGLFLLTGPWLIPALTIHPEARHLALQMLPWLGMTVIFGSLAFALDGLFLGLTAGRNLRNAAAVSLILVFLPLAAFSYVQNSSTLLWIAMISFMAARVLTLGVSFARVRHLWEKRKGPQSSDCE